MKNLEMKQMEIRRAEAKDLPGINRLLHQVLNVHQKGRPDLFRADAKKYTDEELLSLLQEEKTPVFVAVQADGFLSGYAFCVLQQHKNHNILTDIRTLYIDDLCVDETMRGQHIGKQLYDFVLTFAEAQGCYNVTLNVWACNDSALRFYEKCGLRPQKIGMEVLLHPPGEN